MTWWTKSQAEGSHLRVLYPQAEFSDRSAQSDLRVAAERGEYTGQGHRVRSDGSTFWAGVTLTALKDEAGTVLGFVSVMRDITARRAVEAALAGANDAREFRRIAEEANRLKSLFLGSVSHEKRNPLNAILGYVELLDRQTPEDAPHRTLVTKIRNTGRHLQQIVDDVLDMTRIEAGRIPVKLAPSRLVPHRECAVRYRAAGQDQTRCGHEFRFGFRGGARVLG